MLPWQEPSLSSRKEKPPLLSRRVRTHPCRRTARPMASAFRACATLIVSIRSSVIVTVHYSLFIARCSMNSFCRQPAFGVERRHAAGAGRGDGLAVIIVGHVAGGKHALHAGLGAKQRGPFDVAFFRGGHLAF